MSSKNIKNLCMGYDEKQRALMVYGYTGYIKMTTGLLCLRLADATTSTGLPMAAYFCVAQASLSAMVIL